VAAVGLRDFAAMTAEEDAVYVAIEGSPGIPARELGRVLHRQMAAVLKVVQHLVDRGLLARRPLNRVRADGREQTYNGLFAVAASVGAVTPQGRPAGVTEKSEAATVPQASGIGSTPPPTPLVAPHEHWPGQTHCDWPGCPLHRRAETLERKPETMVTSEKPSPPGKVTSQRTALGELGERLGWSRVPITQAREDGGGFRRGRVIDGGEDGWRRAVEELSDDDVEVALSVGRRLLVLLGLR
jgi:hypothetical protein